MTPTQLTDDNVNTVTKYVLIVDDDKDDQHFLRGALEHEVPYLLVESVFDGDEAIDFLSKCESMPNLILLDLNMQRLSGQQTIKLIKANENLRQVPVVIITTSRNKTEREKLLEMGAAGFYTKASKKAELEKLVSEIRKKWLD